MSYMKECAIYDLESIDYDSMIEQMYHPENFLPDYEDINDYDNE